MVFVAKFLVVVISFILGTAILRYTEPIVRTIGKSAWAEHYLGVAGTYTMWKIIGILVPVGTLIFVFRFWP